VVVGDIEGSLEHVDGFVVLLGVLIGETLAMIEFGVVWHYADGIVKVLMGQFYFLQGQIGVASVEERSGIFGVKVQGFVVLCQTLIIHLVVVER
jgi:hypothetical protein